MFTYKIIIFVFNNITMTTEFGVESSFVFTNQFFAESKQSWQSVGTTHIPTSSDPTFVEIDPGRIVKSIAPIRDRVGMGTIDLFWYLLSYQRWCVANEPCVNARMEKWPSRYKLLAQRNTHQKPSLVVRKSGRIIFDHHVDSIRGGRFTPAPEKWPTHLPWIVWRVFREIYCF